MELCGYRPKLILFLLFIAYFTGYFNIIAGVLECFCTTGCNFGSVCSSKTCDRRNMALGRPATISSLFNSTQWNQTSGPACAAVNGNTDHVFRPINQIPDSPNCVHTADNSNPSYWEVDLGQEYDIDNITIYGREYSENQLYTATLSVDNNNCFNFSSSTKFGTDSKVDIPISPPQRGKAVRIYKETGLLMFCEVQVWVACNKVAGNSQRCSYCGHCKDGADCDHVSRNCTNGCEAGWKGVECDEVCNGTYGPDCRYTCGYCTDGTMCNATSGECPHGCKAGYTEKYCNETCRNNTFGAGCNETCGHCVNGGQCNIYDGRCESGCAAGYKPPLCTAVCNGSYGPDCNYTCGNCTDGITCSATSGECPNGCKAGYRGKYCNETCRNNTFGPGCNKTCGSCVNGSQCNIYDGRCEAGCTAGYKPPLCTAVCNGSYGPDCNYTCGNCTDGITCSATSGECQNGCKAGYRGKYCNEKVPSNFGSVSIVKRGAVFLRPVPIKDDCGSSVFTVKSRGGFPVVDSRVHARRLDFKATGEVPSSMVAVFGLTGTGACRNNTFGPGCNKTCGSCVNGSQCNIYDGRCEAGCAAGYKPPLCTAVCYGSYGPDCNYTCGNCTDGITCSATSGECPHGCKAGYRGKYCNERLSKPVDNTPVIAGVTAACVVVVIIVFVVISIVFFRRRKTNSNKQDAGNMAFAHETRAGGKDADSKETTSLTPMPSSTTTSVEAGKADKEKPSIAVKPTVVKMSKGGAARAKRVTPENIYVNLTQDMSLETKPNDRHIPADILPELEDESDHTYRNDENTYAAFMASGPQLDSVQQSLIDFLGSGNLPDQFQELPKGLTDVHEVAKLPVNLKKNRYHSILPYDVNRVVLSDGFSEGKATDFINASYITGLHQTKKYIATQAPRDNTVADFWRMVWQEQITQIVMLTGLVENGKDKCFEYWPGLDQTETYGPVTVTGVDVQRKAHFFVRTFIVRMSGSGEEREVEQLNFVTWPDHGVPTTTSLLNFWRFAKARAPQRPPPPVLVHCTAGVGRTGTYIGLDIAYDQVVSQGDVNPFEIVERMRTERCTMVQAADQYIFLHKALLEGYTAGETTIANDRFDKVFPKPITARKENPRIDREFKRAMQMRSLTPAIPVTTASEDSNKTMIRNTTFLPADDHLVYLTAHVPGRNQFINAVYMPTYREYNGSILTQLPLEKTLVDFWRLVDGCDVKIIVSLGHENEQETVPDYCQFWPKGSRTSLPVDPYIIRHKATSTLGINLKSYTVSLEKKKVPESRQVQLLHYEAWAGELPENTTDLLALIDKIDSLCLGENNPPPVIIQCQDGVTRSGLFAALWNVFSRLTSDKEVDVYMAVREVHRVRPQAVTSLEQYRCCYEVAQKRVSELNIYTNA